MIEEYKPEHQDDETNPKESDSKSDELIEKKLSSAYDILDSVKQTLSQFFSSTFFDSLNRAMENLNNQLAEMSVVFEKASIAMLAGLQKFSKSIVISEAIEKLGSVQFVSWDFMPYETAQKIVDCKNLNTALRKYFEEEKYESIYNIVEKCQQNPLFKSNLKLFNQCINAFKNGDRDLAVLGFVSIIDSLLTIVSGRNTTSITKRADIIVQKFEQKEEIENDEYALIVLITTFKDVIDSYSEYADFSKKEPAYLNRHWIAHGYSTRRKTKLDCVKLIHMIYAILLIDELS